MECDFGILPKPVNFFPVGKKINRWSQCKVFILWKWCSEYVFLVKIDCIRYWSSVVFLIIYKYDYSTMCDGNLLISMQTQKHGIISFVRFELGFCICFFLAMAHQSFSRCGLEICICDANSILSVSNYIKKYWFRCDFKLV